MSRRLRKIIATTDVRSVFNTATPMLTHPHTGRAESLIVDCGDFFEGSGYYRFSKGQIECELFTILYDLLAPGNHGWPHYFEPGLHEMTVCANASDDNGKPLFDRVRTKRVGGQRVAITAVIGPQAFNTISTRDRNGHHVTIFAGHCHSDTHGPVHIDNTLVFKGRELGVGYATAEGAGPPEHAPSPTPPQYPETSPRCGRRSPSSAGSWRVRSKP